MTDKKEYQPISCAEHDTYEIAIMRKQHLHIAWHDKDKRSFIDVLKPTDLITRNHAEYLVATNQNGTQVEIRLDYIRHSEPV